MDETPAAPTRVETIALAVALAIVGGLAVSRLLYPYDLGHYEAATWEPARLLATGRNPYDYRLTIEPPYVMAPYGPLYYAVLAVGFRLFGPQFWFGRMASVLGLLVTAGALWCLTRRFSGRRDLAAAAAVAFLAQPAVQAWMAVHRPDTIALALGFLAMLSASAPPRAGIGAQVAAAACMAGALLTRQTTILPALVIVAFYVATGRGRHALIFAGLTAAMLAVVMAGLEWTSPGGYLWQQFSLPGHVPLSLDVLAVGLRTLAEAPATWMLLALGLAGLWSRRRSRDVERPWAVTAWRLLVVGYVVLAIGLALVTSARAGSNINYWLEASAAVALGAALVAERVLASPRARAIVFAALALAAILGARPHVGAERARWRARPYLDTVVARLKDVQPASAPMLSMYPELIVYAGREPWFGDPIPYDGRSPAHRDLLIATLHSGILAALVLPFDHATQGYERMPGLEPPRDVPAVFVFTRKHEITDALPTWPEYPEG